MLKKAGTYYHTIRHLKWRQIIYRLWYSLRDRVISHRRHYMRNYPAITLRVIQPVPFIPKKETFTAPGRFTFLNRTKSFGEEGIRWNWPEYGKLWSYHLSYFDFLNQERISREDGLRLIRDFMASEPGLKDARDPYPVSLRLINWLKFIYRHHIDDQEINAFMMADLQTLDRQLEYHLLANHLLENAFSMTIAGYCLQHKRFYEKGRRLLDEQLAEQIMDDGAHYEKSPMYHQILLDRLLDTINFLGDNAETSLKEAASRMLSWLRQMTFSDGSVPYFNDATPGEAPASDKLLAYAERLGIKTQKRPLSDSGYRVFRNSSYQLAVDCGGPGPTYQPGHSHNDAGSFVLHIQGKPVIVDTAVSTYEISPERQYERSVSSHNTTHPAGAETSEIWGSFRMGRREMVHIAEEQTDGIVIHRSFPHLTSAILIRRIQCDEKTIRITDKLTGTTTEKTIIAYLHFAPSMPVRVDGNRIVAGPVVIRFGNADEIALKPCRIAAGFNKHDESNKVEVRFQKKLISEIVLGSI